MEKFKQDQKNFIEAMKEYDVARRTINRIFKESVDKALSNAKSLSSPDQTQLQKRQSAVAKQRAIIAATAIRDAAIEALGPPPIPPTPPAKAPRLEKSKKPESVISPSPASINLNPRRVYCARFHDCGSLISRDAYEFEVRSS